MIKDHSNIVAECRVDGTVNPPTILTANGPIASVTRLAIGNYRIARQQNFGIGWDALETVALATAEGTSGFICTVVRVDDNTVDVRVWDISGYGGADAIWNWQLRNARR